MVFTSGLTTDLNENPPFAYANPAGYLQWIGTDGNEWVGTTGQGVNNKSIEMTGQYFTDA